jgi:hypothetical protein
VKHGIAQPSIPLPGIFSTIANLQKDRYSGMRTEDFCPDLPPGTVVLGEKWVRSKTLSVAGLDSTCHIVGRFDIVAKLDDGSFAAMDFKTGNPSEGKVDMYGRQLHSYAVALENPGLGELRLAPVSRLGLLFFTPDQCEYLGDGRQTLEGSMRWFEVERDDATFMGFLREVVGLLDGPMPPPQTDGCDWCKYRSFSVTARQAFESFAESDASEIAVPKCPRCGGPMRLRTGRYGQFWGCTKYPDCRGTRPG